MEKWNQKEKLNICIYSCDVKKIKWMKYKPREIEDNHKKDWV